MNSFGASLMAALALLVYCNLVSSSDIANPSRPAMGHFPKLPGGQGDGWYKRYFNAFYNTDLASKEGLKYLDDQDWRLYSPTSTECVDYLRRFVANDYKLGDYIDLIYLDACLGYLYDDYQYKWTDQTSPKGKEIVESLVNDEKLKNIYTGTQMETWNPEGLKFVLDFIDNGLSLPSFRYKLCIVRVQLMMKYADNRGLLANPEEDTYVKLLDDYAKSSGQRCFKGLLKEYADYYQFVHYDTSILPNPKNLLPSKARKQLRGNNWSKQMQRILQKSMGLSSSASVDLDQLQAFEYQLKMSDPKAQQQLLTNMSHYANKELKKPSSREEAQANYSGLKDTLCKEYISETENIWIRMIGYSDFFGDLESLLYRYPDESLTSKVRIMYLTTFMCRYVGTTDATATSGRYAVLLSEDSANTMQIWPMSPPAH